MIAIKTERDSGTMGDLIARKEWGGTSLGPYSDWSQPFRTTLSLMLASRFPMFLSWGEEMLCFYNDACQPYLGIGARHSSIIGTPVRETFSEAWPVIAPFIGRVMENGGSYAMEDLSVPLFRNGTTDIWTGLLSFSPVIGDGEKPLGVLAMCLETTNKLAVLNEIREREEQLQFILDAAELATWNYNPKTQSFKMNKRLQEWLGLRHLETVDLELAMNSVLPEDQQKVRQSIAQSIRRRSGGKHDIVYTIIHPLTGSHRIVRAKGKAFFHDNEDLAYRFNGTLQDTTDEVLAQQSLKKSEENFRDLLENSPLAMCLLTGEQYQVVSINENMLNMLGKSFTESHNHSFFDIAPAILAEQLRSILNNARSTGERFSARALPLRLPKGGRPGNRFIDFACEPIPDESGGNMAIIVALSDVTDQVLRQKKLDQKKEDLKKQMLKASIDAQEKERELISNELHDNVNQLLACTKLFLELIQPENEITKLSVSRSSAFIGQAMDEIRDISHALHPGILNFVGLFKSIREMLEKLNRTNQIIFRFDYSRCNKDWKQNDDIELSIFRIVQRQVANIVQHSGATSASIILSSGADCMELLISDDGRGFDPKKTGKGLGLLNIVNRVELLDGSVSLKSAPGKGCRLRIRIPAQGRRLSKTVNR